MGLQVLYLKNIGQTFLIPLPNSNGVMISFSLVSDTVRESKQRARVLNAIFRIMTYQDALFKFFFFEKATTTEG